MCRVLIVDDEPDIRVILSYALECTPGWSTLSAESGAEGIQMAIEQQPDVIVLDACMPGVDGPSTFQAIQADAGLCCIPVVLLTALASTRDRVRFLAMGFAGVITKPFNPLTIAEEIQQVLAKAVPTIRAFSTAPLSRSL